MPDLRTCKIVKETYKTANIPKSSQQLVEAINIDGKLFEVSLNTTRIYSYNDAGQLIKEEFSQWDKGYGSAVYLYKNNRIVITKTFHDGNSNKVSTTTDTLDLNAQGLAKKQSGNPVTYDENGFKKYLGTPPFEFYAIKKGNTEQIIYPNWTGEGGTFTIQHAYDTTKLSIPSNKPFLGIFSKNLLTESTNIMQGSSHYVDGPNYHISYKYSFDKYNRISRRVALGKRLHPLWDLELDRGGIGVTNFEYQCE